MPSETTPPNLLDLDTDEFVRRGGDVMDWIARYLAETRKYPVLAQVAPGDLAAQLPTSGPELPVAWDAILSDLDNKIVPAMTHWNHPRFFAYFANTGSAPGILGATLAAAFNTNGMLWRTAPAAAELEERVTQWLAQWLGLGDMPFGIINDTASTSSLVAIAAAREAVPAYDRQVGMHSVGPLRLYASEQAHSSIDKAAAILGLGLDAVRRIPTDNDYALDPAALAAAIVEDRAQGHTPFCVVATVGTTSTTSVDPVAATAEIARREGLWLHVDAAYGGAAALLPEKRDLFAGWEGADSVVLNPHKWLFTPMCSSVLYTRRPEMLEQAFSLVPEYLRSDVGTDPADVPDDAPIDYMNFGIQLGRPFRSLTLWMVLCTYGRKAIAELVRSHVAWAAELATMIDAHEDFERLAPTPMSTVCFRYREAAGPTDSGRRLEPVDDDPWAAANESLMARINADGSAFLSHTRLRGRMTLRLTIGNLRSTRADVQTTWELLQRLAREGST
jgi:aromatic-L-amino-acid decarboxylase